MGLFSFAAANARAEFGYVLEPAVVVVDDPEYQRQAHYSGMVVQDSVTGAHMGDVWRGPGLTWCWRTSKDYGHTQSQQDAIQSVVRQAGQR